MGTLRFKINSENINVSNLFRILGFKEDSELNFNEFHKFLDYISPQITEEEVRYFFDKVDTDESSTISIKEIEEEMSQHKIATNHSSIIKKANTLQEEDSPKLSTGLAEKAKICF
jgi:Ca2+-binding EF-hand superfamily protein